MTRYRTFMVDPPYPETGGGKIKRGCDRHYPVIKKRETMLDVITESPAWQARGPDVHLYWWSTDNYLSWAFWLLDQVGAKVHRTLPWTKEQSGIGQYFLGAHELCIFATIGSGYNVRTALRNLRTDALVGAKQPRDAQGKRIHSAKPAEAYALAQARSKGPYMDLFGRPDINPHEGWDTWGKQARRRRKPKLPTRV